MKTPTRIAAILTATCLLAGCALIEAALDDLGAAMEGRPATMSTYDQAGQPIDRVHGDSIRVERESDFDSTGRGSDGVSIKLPDSAVLQISIGDNTIHHVGSSMVIAEDGITTITDAPATVDLTDTEPGSPWLNSLLEDHRNLWDGKAKTVLIRSQDGQPVGVYAGDSVEIYATDIPKSTRFQIDGKYLFVYRVDFTVYDTELFG